MKRWSGEVIFGIHWENHLGHCLNTQQVIRPLKAHFSCLIYSDAMG